jgi:hypothetical protein
MASGDGIKGPVALTKAVPFYTIPLDGDRPLFRVEAGMDARYAREVQDRVLAFLCDRAEARMMGEGSDEEAWIHWFLLSMVKSLRTASGDVQ